MGDGPPLGRNQPRSTPADEPSPCKLIQVWVHINGCTRSTVEHELALRPGFSPQGPDATDGATRATRREAWVTGFDCRAGAVLLRALPHRPGGLVPNVSERSQVLVRFLSARARAGREGLMTMKRTEHNSAARRRGELTRDRGSRRVSVAIDARRRLNSVQAAGLRTRAGAHVPRDPRFAYLTQSHD